MWLPILRCVESLLEETDRIAAEHRELVAVTGRVSQLFAEQRDRVDRLNVIDNRRLGEVIPSE